MKTMINNIAKYFARVAAVAMVAALPMLTACEDKLFESNIALGVNYEKIALVNQASTTPISIYSNGDWTAHLEPQVNWASIDRTSGSKNEQITLTYSSNPDAIRRVTLVVKSGSNVRRVLIEQEGAAVKFRFKLDGREVTIEKPQATRFLTFETNIPLDQYANVEVRELKFLDSENIGWISNPRIEGRVLAFDVLANDGDVNRSASISVAYVDPYDGAEFTTNATVTQSTEESVGITIDELIANYETAVVAGEVNANGEWVVTSPYEIGIKIVGVGVSSSEGLNTASNTVNQVQTTSSGSATYNAISHEENGRTAYLQNETGTQGIRILAASAADNIISPFAEAQVRVDGITMVREENPTRYTLKDVPVYHIVGVGDANSVVVPAKEKYINELTDADVYTYVTLKDVEFTFKQGSFFNTNNGYKSRCDFYPVCVRDIQGGTLYMFANHSVDWVRNGNPIPQGSGNLRGVITYETSNDYGVRDGSMGRYSIRPYDKNDLMVEATADNRYKTIVEWDWNNKVLDMKTGNKVQPIVGTGDLYHDNGVAPTLANNFNYLKVEFNEKNEEIKANTSSAIRYTTKWMDTNGDYIGLNFDFSTLNETGSNPVITFCGYGGSSQSETGTGSLVVSYWTLHYSIDGGETFTQLPDCEFTFRPFVYWNNLCPIYATMGVQEYAYNLPEEILGKENVRIRMVPAISKMSSSHGASNPKLDGQTLDSSKTAGMVLCNVTVKYNK